MQEPLAVIPLTWDPTIAGDAVAWVNARAEFVRWNLEGKAQVRRDGAYIDLVSLSTMAAAKELDGAELVIFNKEVLAAWRATHGPE